MELQPKNVFKYFRALSDIPHGSGNEAAISDYLVNLGKQLGYETYQDKVKNVMMIVPATKGYENSKRILIQGHMDMVCEKGETSTHNFLTDPIEWIVEGDHLHANDTTLGADDGIGVALALGLAESKEHGPLKLIITISEETDMSGAKNMDPSWLEGDYLINIDSEEEGYLTAASAGGKNYEAHFHADWEKGSAKVFDLTFGGLLGGHSGVEIDKPKGNMIKIMADFVSQSEGRLVTFDSGSKDNAIPRTGTLTLEMPEEKIDSLITSLKEKYSWTEGELTISYQSRNYEGELQTTESTLQFANYLLALPTGVKTFTDASKKYVESSSNLAIVHKEGSDYLVRNLYRFAKSTCQDEFDAEFESIGKEYPMVEYQLPGFYPQWEYKENSPFRDTAVALYKEMTGKDMEVVITHGGLEGGVFFQKNPNLDIISIGPDMTGAHTPKETLSISSTERVYNYLVELLKRLK